MIKEAIISTYLLLLLLFPPPSYCDLPVHCIADDIQGHWSLNLQPTSTHFSKCGHQSPDKNTDHLYSDVNNTITTVSVIVDLQFPDILVMDGQIVGRWTMVYDEGFEMVINGTSYFAFSRYVYEGNSQPKDDDDEKSDGYKS